MGNSKCCKSKENEKGEINFLPDQPLPSKQLDTKGRLFTDINNLPNTNTNILTTVRSNNQNLQDNPNSNIPSLHITVLNSQTIQKGTKIIIDSTGLKNMKSLRKEQDGFVYFGYSDNLIQTNQNPEEAIDFILPPNKDKSPIQKSANYSKYLGRYFQIYYNVTLNGYFLRDLGNGLGTFIKIKDAMVLKDNSLINIGDCYIVINFDSTEMKSNPTTGYEDNYGTVESNWQGLNRTLVLKVHNERNENKIQTYTFEPSKGVVRIGRRKHGNDIEIEDPLASKTNCNIQYLNKEGWVIKDGNELMNSNGEKQVTRSTNGTWILAIEDFRIYEGMVFKGHFNLFSCNFKENCK